MRRRAVLQRHEPLVRRRIRLGDDERKLLGRDAQELFEALRVADELEPHRVEVLRLDVHELEEPQDAPSLDPDLVVLLPPAERLLGESPGVPRDCGIDLRLRQRLLPGRRETLLAHQPDTIGAFANRQETRDAAEPLGGTFRIPRDALQDLHAQAMPLEENVLRRHFVDHADFRRSGMLEPIVSHVTRKLSRLQTLGILR